MNCPQCEHENPNDAQFCGACGSALALDIVCAPCGRSNPASQRFCHGCGNGLGEPSSAPERAPRSYTPKHLADKILQSKSALEGERKQVTVLFADVKGSMELAEQLDPEAWHGILERFFEILTDGVHRFEGTVNQYTGDGIMALFGAPIAHEDHAQRACYAALHLIEALRPFAREVKRAHGVTLSTRIGLNSGDVVVGRIGDDLRMDYTAQGHTVGLAQRMEGLASPDTIYLSGATAALIEGYFDLEDLGPFRLKGASEPVPVFQLLRTGAQRTRFDRSRARGLTRFVGRDADVRTLEDALAQARAGNGQVVGIVAEAGTGKSRLCFEFVERCRRDGLRVNEGQALAHGRNVPLLPILQAFRAYYGLDERDDARTVREKIAGRMVLLDATFQEDLPVLFDFFGAADPEHPAPTLDTDARQRRLFQILRRTTRLGGGDGGAAVTLLEDLHWFDAASEEFLKEWVEAVAGTRSLLLLNFRPEYQPAWIGRSYYRQLPLAPLGADAIRELLEDLLGHDPSTKGLADRIHARTGGNPFFAEEVAQSLIESGSLVGERGHYRLVPGAEDLAIPDSVQSILAARIDRLGEREKQVLQAAAVIGKEFPEPVLREVTALPERDLSAALAALAQAEFVREIELYPVAEYTFKHPLTQEVALGSQLAERRRRVHGAVVAALERFHADRLDEKAALFAHHLEEAGDAPAAATWHTRAATWTSRTDWAQGNWHWRRVLALTDDAPASPERDRLRLNAILAVFTTGWRLGLNVEEIEALFDEARRLVRAADDREAEIQLITKWAMFTGNQGDARRYHALTSEACALLNDGLSAETHAHASMLASHSAYCLGRYSEALEHQEQIVRYSEGSHERGLATGGFPTWSNGWRFRALILIGMGRLDEARASSAKAEEILRDEPRSEVNGWALGDRLRLALTAGLVPDDDPRPAALDELNYTERVGSDFARVTSLVNCCLAHGLAGDWVRAVESGREAIAVANQHKIFQQEKGFTYGLLTWALRDDGKAADGCEAATEGVEWSEAHGLAYQEALCRIERAGALRESEAASAADRIERDLERVAVLIEETSGRSLLPRLVEERARLTALRGQSASPGLDEALALYREIGATGHAARLAKELGL